MEDLLPRKLAAILYADVAGYSKLTGENEDETHQTLRQCLDQLSTIVSDHDGSVVHYAGDAVLARFNAALDALSAAIDAQKKFDECAKEDDHLARLRFRIGINLGDVIEDRGDIYGDGVNIAARLEALAEPGGICVSESIRTALGSKLSIGFESLGLQQVKNIKEPIVAYRVLFDGRMPDPTKDSFTRTSMVSKPSILVLPFTGNKQDSEDEYLIDGITEEIRLGLCRFKGIIVVARGSSFEFKNESISALEAAKKVNADYVLEGSVRKSGNRIRVIAGLVKVSTEQQVLAERYDRTLEDLFEIQDEISRLIITKLVGRIEEDLRDTALRKGTGSLTAHDYFLRGNYYFNDWRGSRENVELAGEMYQRAIDQDPEYAAAYAGLAGVKQNCFEHGWADNREETGEEAIQLARKAVELDPQDSLARLVLAASYFKVRGDFELAKPQIQAALELNPNHYWNYCFNCWFATCAGDLQEGIQCGTEAIQRNPLLPDGCLYTIGFAEYLSGRYEQALDAYGRMSNPHPEDEACIAACYAQLGRIQEAKKAANEFRRLIAANDPDKDPGADMSKWKSYWLSHFPLKDSAALDHVIDGIKKAGLIA